MMWVLGKGILVLLVIFVLFIVAIAMAVSAVTGAIAGLLDSFSAKKTKNNRCK